MSTVRGPPLPLGGVTRPPRRAARGARLRRVAAVSLALHALAIAALLLGLPREHLNDLDALPAVTVSLEAGPRAPAASPNPTLESSVAPPSPEAAEPGPSGAATPPAETATAAAPPPVSAPLAPPEAAATGPPPPPAPPAVATPAPAKIPAATAEQAPPGPVAAPLGEVPLPVPPVPPASPPPQQLALARPPALPSPVVPRPVPPRPTPVRPLTAQPRAAPARPREFAAPGERVDPHSGFPLPMSLAFGNALSHLGSGIGHAPDRERAGPVDPGRRSYGGADTRGDLAGDDLGPEWASLLHAWVDAHKFYPEEAAMKGEDGTAQVRVVLRRSGAVQSVDLTERSGSVFLDAALQALFRAQHLPPFPPTDPDDSATIYFTMHYILVR